VFNMPYAKATATNIPRRQIHNIPRSQWLF
jgi:hypothetical protein